MSRDAAEIGVAKKNETGDVHRQHKCRRKIFAILSNLVQLSSTEDAVSIDLTLSNQVLLLLVKSSKQWLCETNNQE